MNSQNTSRPIKERILNEANARLEAWRAEHAFSEEMKELLSSPKATDYFSRKKIDMLHFFDGDEMLRHAGTKTEKDRITISFKAVPIKAQYDISGDRVRVSFAEADRLYANLAQAAEADRLKAEIEAYLRGKEIRASLAWTGRPGEFRLTFPFAYSAETEVVTVGKTYKRIVSAAYRTARDKAAKKRKEQEDYLKTCPVYGTFVAQAVLDTLEDNNNRLTAAQIIDILRGTKLTEEFVFGKFTGKYRLLEKSEIGRVIDALVDFGVIHKRRVHGEYQNYYVHSVTSAGRLFSEMQNAPGAGGDILAEGTDTPEVSNTPEVSDTPKVSSTRRRPATEQEYYLYLKSVRDEISEFSDRKKQELAQVIAERPGIFLTDPELVLDIVEAMGRPAEDCLRGLFATEDRRSGRDILRLLMNAAAGKGKVLPKNGLTAFRKREEKKRREREESERRDRELFEMVLTEIPDNYVDLYPAARSMKRHFVLHIGPTNSGKTHDAIEELMQAERGIYLAPLRLLAYEQYERMNRAECPCSLVTGEEQFLIEGAKHQSSTIEMLSLKVEYDVAVIDEAQMIADGERGGAWTAAIMGVCASKVHVCAAPEAEKRITQIIRDCGDDYEIIRHRRMTPLVYEEKAFRFPQDVRPGDALIVFSRSNVHSVAAQLKKRNVSCSIIYGALPYDVRHRQAELFAEGKNDVVVATDAIGMGMNLPIRRVVLMETTKFDGFNRRPLRYDEIRQIVGRAGRFGIYDTGYAASANGDKRVKIAITETPYPIKRAVIDFPESLLTVDAPILDLIKKWEQVIPAEGWYKESIEQMRSLAELTKNLRAPKKLAYDFLTIPFEEENGALLDIWYRAFVNEVRGEKYSIYDQVSAIALKKPSSADAIDALEQQHRVLDLYFNLARKFQPLESTLQLIMEKKRICSGRIMKVLETRGFKERRCRSCGKMLPWNHPYGICEKCHAGQRGRSW